MNFDALTNNCNAYNNGYLNEGNTTSLTLAKENRLKLIYMKYVGGLKHYNSKNKQIH